MSVTITCICHKTHIFKVIQTIHGSFNKKIIFIFVKKNTTRSMSVAFTEALWPYREMEHAVKEKQDTFMNKITTLTTTFNLIM